METPPRSESPPPVEPFRNNATDNLSLLLCNETEQDLSASSISSTSLLELSEDSDQPSKDRRKVTPQARYWCFTEHNVEAGGMHLMTNCVDLLTKNKLKYAVWQRETCPKSGKDHFQGYVELSRSQRLSYLKNKISTTAHWEVKRGTREQARDYCMKSKTRTVGYGPSEVGKFIPSKQGKRSDLESVKEKLDAGMDLTDIAKGEDFTACIKYHRGLEWYTQHCMLRNKPRDGTEPCTVDVYYGPAGCGKTWLANKSYPTYYVKPAHTKWWDGYKGQKGAIFDEMNCPWTVIDKLLTWFDRYNCIVETKGSTMPLCVTHFVVTTNTHPKQWYPDIGDRWPALARRITQVYVFNGDEVGKFEKMDIQDVPLI